MPALPLPPGTTSHKAVDHAGWIVESAIQQDTIGYPLRVDPPVIVKKQSTPRMATTVGLAERVTGAQAIYDSLEVVDPAAVAGRTIVVVDDVFTTGNTLNAVARRLREAGAKKVYGLTLARQGWGT